MAQPVKCTCGSTTCKTQIAVSTVNPAIHLWFTEPHGIEILMYLDANAAVQLICQLKAALQELI